MSQATPGTLLTSPRQANFVQICDIEGDPITSIEIEPYSNLSDDNSVEDLEESLNDRKVRLDSEEGVCST